VFADLADSLADLVLPRACYGCGRGGTTLCRTCAPLAMIAVEHAGVAAVAAGPYDGALRDALLAYKERGRRDLAGPLAARLAAAVSALDAPDAVLVPIPSTAGARRARGGDHVRRLARRAGRTAPALRLTRAVRDSAGLDAAERAANLAGALCARPPGHPRAPAIVADDIVTTGATLREGARALALAGWSVAGAAVVAATPLRFPPAASRVARCHRPV
jgi:predicted amidophosphoribosyltransferase